MTAGKALTLFNGERHRRQRRHNSTLSRRPSRRHGWRLHRLHLHAGRTVRHQVGGINFDDEYYSLIVFSENQDSLLSLAAKVRTDLDRAAHQTILGVAIAGVQYQDASNIDFDDKTMRFEVELRFKVRVKR
jgi:hypothetical protein